MAIRALGLALAASLAAFVASAAEVEGAVALGDALSVANQAAGGEPVVPEHVAVGDAPIDVDGGAAGSVLRQQEGDRLGFMLEAEVPAGRKRGGHGEVTGRVLEDAGIGVPRTGRRCAGWPGWRWPRRPP